MDGAERELAGPSLNLLVSLTKHLVTKTIFGKPSEFSLRNFFCPLRYPLYQNLIARQVPVERRLKVFGRISLSLSHWPNGEASRSPLTPGPTP